MRQRQFEMPAMLNRTMARAVGPWIRVSQPRVAEPARPPWVTRKNILNPEGVLSSRSRIAITPLGLMNYVIRFPRVARSSQPWAEGRNPFEILLRSTLGGQSFNDWVLACMKHT
jgi:hypothetical protein